MNKERKQKIKGFNKELDDLYCRLASIRDEEEDYYDNIPENLQSSERAEESEEYIRLLDEILDHIGDIMDNLAEIN